MENSRKILVINLGSTSSKIAYCVNDRIIRQVELQHDTKLLRALKGAEEITAFFGKAVEDFIADAGLDLATLDAIAVRGIGKSGSYRHGAYRLTPERLADVTSGPVGHIGLYSSTVIGGRLSEKYGVPGVITGFEPVDVLQGIAMIMRQLHEGRAEIEIAYARGVMPEGNPHAIAAIDEVFETCTATFGA